MTLADLQEIVLDAVALADRRDFLAARDTYLVAADMAEQMGYVENARNLRRRARQMHVVDWARRELDPSTLPMDVQPPWADGPSRRSWSASTSAAV